MCGGDDHLAWKRPVSSEACRGLRTVGGYDRFYQRYFKVHPYPFRATLPLQVEPQILRLRLSPLHVGASEGLQSLFSYSSDPVFPLFSLQLRVLGDRYEFEYGWITFRLVALVRVFHLMSLACFLPRAFLFSFLGSTHPSTLLSLTRYFGICSLIIFLHCIPIMGSVPHHLFDPWFDFRLDAHIFIIER